jgi:LPXTG-site transpeptidase (sortase) family protein
VVAAAGPAGPADEDRVAVPARVRFPELDVDAPVAAVGVDALGEMEVPEDVATVGWYRFGPGPGAGEGSAVLSGHVDDRIQGRGAFYQLSDLEPGDPVAVELADGTAVDYRVTVVERIDKDELPVDRLFARDGAPRLTLVTCGGDFDRQARSYRENVVVTAEPIGG